MQSANQSLNQSQNQFINSNPDKPVNPQQMKQFYNMMMSFMKKPQMLNAMMSQFTQNQQSKSPIDTKIQPQNSNAKFQSKSRYQYRNLQNLNSSQSMPTYSQNNMKKHQKGKDVLKNYLPKQTLSHQLQTQRQKSQLQNLGTSLISEYPQQQLNIKEKYKNSTENYNQPKQISKNIYDEIPIKTNYTQQNFEKNVSLTQKAYQNDYCPTKPQFTSYDDQPIKSQHQQQMQMQLNQSRLNSPSKQLIQQIQQRPVCGNSKSFDDMIRQELMKHGFKQGSVQTNDHLASNNNSRTNIQKPKNFLKKGTRNYLSGARDNKEKSDKSNELEISQNQSIKDVSKNRSISQNRVLARKRQNQSQNKHHINKSQVQNHTPRQRKQLTKVFPSNNIPPKMKETTPKKGKNSMNTYSPKIDNKKKINIFANDSDQQENSCEKTKTMISIRKKQIIPNVFLSDEQISLIIRKCSDEIKRQQQKLSKIRTKYSDLKEILELQKIQIKKQRERQKEAFEQYKILQMNKIKNQRRVMERQLKSTQPKQNYKEEVQNLKKQLEKQKEDTRKKDKNNRIIIEKYKKQIQELKNKLTQVQFNCKQTISNFKSSPNSLSYKNKHHQAVQQRQNIQTKYINTNKQQQLPLYEALKNKKKPVYEYFQDNKSKKNNYLYQQINQENQNIEEEDEVNNQDQQSNQQTIKKDITLNELSKMDLNIKMVTDYMIENTFRYFTNSQYISYLAKKKSPTRKLMHTSQNTLDGRTTHIYNDGGKQVVFHTGVRKQYFQNGYTVIHFKNGDVKQKLTDGTVLYYFKEKQVDQITFPNQINIYRFENNQVQFHFPQGRVQIRHPDGTIKVMSASNG